MKKPLKYSLSAAVLLSAGLGAAGCTLASYTVHGKRQTLQEAFAWQSEHYDTGFYETLEKENYLVSSFDGYELHVQLCRCPQPSEKYIILSHGYTDNRYGSLKYMRIYLDRGYNCIIYDLRGHGENQPHICTYSLLEGKDLYELIKDTRERYPALETLGLHGESLGASATVSSLGYQIWARADHIQTDYVDFAVADCGFADIENVLKGAIKSAHLPAFLVAVSSAGSKVRYGFSFSQMRPIEMLPGNKVPLLFIHGENDTFILPENSRRMAEATGGYSEVRLVPQARHADSVLTDPVLYRKYVYDFLDEIRK